MATVLVFTAPDPTSQYQWSVVDTRTGKGWSPSKSSFLAAPADGLMPMVPDTDPHRPLMRYGYLGFKIVSPSEDQYQCFVHDMNGVQLYGPIPIPTA